MSDRAVTAAGKLHDRIKELEADNKQLVEALEARGSTIVEVHKLGKINKLEAQLADEKMLHGYTNSRLLNATKDESRLTAQLDKVRELLDKWRRLNDKYEGGWSAHRCASDVDKALEKDNDND